MESKGTNKLLVVAVSLMAVICVGVLYLVYAQLTNNQQQTAPLTEEPPAQMPEVESEQLVEQEQVAAELVEEEAEFVVEEVHNEVDFYEESAEWNGEEYYEEEGPGLVDYLTIPDYLEESPTPRTMPLIRFDGMFGEWIDTTLAHGFLMQGSGYVERANHSNELGQDATIYFNVKNTSEDFNYTLRFQDLYIDDQPFEDEDYYHSNLHSEYHIGSTLAPGAETQLLLEFSEFSMLREELYTPFPAFNQYIYGELVVTVATEGVRLVDHENFEVYFVPFTMPLY